MVSASSESQLAYLHGVEVSKPKRHVSTVTRPHLGLRHGTIDDLAHLASTPTISPSAIAPLGIEPPKRHVSTVTRPHLGLRHGTIDDLAHLASTPTSFSLPHSFFFTFYYCSIEIAWEKLKKVLSPNPEVALNIECLMDEKDIGPFHGPQKSKARIKVQLNLHGIISIESSTLVEELVSETIENVTENNIDNKCESPNHFADGTTQDEAKGRLHVPVSENIYGGMTKAEILEAQEKELWLAH
ncbi:hypothetical protein Fmac_004550 [Flemingia macrophylla]|uniref:Uncharacterized protein n=1 Tax=Flemingia macrophylla TaxID=520843 RepID=A0ABD1N7V8_9FABA